MIHHKKGFLILSVIFLMFAFSYYSIQIVQNQTFSSQIDTLKYLEIQAKIHLKKYENYIQYTNEESLILNYKIDDDRFVYTVKSEHNLDENSSETTSYHITIKAKDEPITLYKKIIK